MNIARLKSEVASTNDILVSIFMVTYNHEKYIKQAIESIIMQEVTFRYEIIIGEDNSTDSTKNIIELYRGKYPDIIKLILQPYNKGALQNSVDVLEKCTGKYIAWLEGDDYWLTKDKLQKQVDFLEKNKQYIATSHNSKRLYNGKFIEISGEFGTDLPERIIKKEDALKNCYMGHTSSWVFRNFYINMEREEKKKYWTIRMNGDSSLPIVWSMIGDTYFFEDKLSVHRVEDRQGDSWSVKQFNRNLNKEYYEINIEFKEYMQKEFHEEMCIDWKLLYFIKSSFFIWVKNPSKENRDIFFTLFNDGYFSKSKIIKYILERKRL